MTESNRTVHILSISSSTKVATSSSSSSDTSGHLTILAFFLILVLCQICLFIFCYWNTKRLKKKSDSIRERIGQEYSRLREEQYLNQGVNSQLRLNYYLVEPTNPAYKVWNGGRAIGVQQPVATWGQEAAQPGSFSQYYQQGHA